MASAIREFERYKALGEKTFERLSEEEIQFTYKEDDNSIAQIVKHLVGNMRSRWTNFLEEDGEKSWRNRDTEFVDPFTNKEELKEAWSAGWKWVFDALAQVNEDNFSSTVRIRQEPHSIIQAIHRQLAHYASHVGQLVYLGKSIKGEQWVSLSIPKGKSEEFNKKYFNSK
ncbi:MAG: DUF1572 domain-containing protein [Bacteroidia bacterium]|nr:DUF1572 domain-containing protein [Bacteroidia bacterium]